MIKLLYQKSKSTIKNQRSKIKDSRLHLVACNRNQRFTLHTCRTSFHVVFHVISCYISHHFMSHFIHFIVRITYITHISRTSRISHFTHIAHFMYCTTLHVILCIISCHFVMKIHIILIHNISHWREKKTSQNATLFNRVPPEWGIFQTIKTPPRAGILSVWCNFARESHFSQRPLVAIHQTLILESCKPC